MIEGLVPTIDQEDPESPSREIDNSKEIWELPDY